MPFPQVGIMDERHLADLLKQQVPPPPATVRFPLLALKLSYHRHTDIHGS